jgi:hypothetical protein
MYLLTDAVVDRNFPLLDCFNDSLEDLEESLRNAVELSSEGPIVVHVLTQKGRGYPFFRRTAEAFGSMEGPEVLAPIKELLTQNASNPELTRQLFDRLADNKTLRENPDFAPMIASLVLDEAFGGDDIRELMLDSLDDVKTPIAKDALTEIIGKSKSEQVKASARKVLEANFPAPPPPPAAKDAGKGKKK